MEKEYLLPTKICDIENVDIRMRSYILTKNVFGVKEKAIKIFNFVRDEIKYRFDYPFTKASETLKKGYGNCFNKTNLQIALLRSAGIYSGYRVYLIKKAVFKSVVPPEIYELISEPTVHVSTAIWIDEKWIEADATIDYELYNCIYRNIENWKYGKWDGENDFTLPEEFIVEDQGVYSNIDLYLLNPPKFWNDKLLKEANTFIEEKIKNEKRH